METYERTQKGCSSRENRGDSLLPYGLSLMVLEEKRVFGRQAGSIVVKDAAETVYCYNSY